MIIKRYKTLSFLIFVASLLCIILMAVSFWNTIVKTDIQPGGKMIALFFLTIVFIVASYIVFLTATQTKYFEGILTQKLLEERTRTLAEFEKKETKEKLNIDETEISKLVSDFLPTGNFKNANSYANKLINQLANYFQVAQGIIFIRKAETDTFTFLTGYATTENKDIPDFTAGENLTGQAVLNKEATIISDIPENYFTIESGLGKSQPRNLIILPFVNNNEVIAVMELATFKSAIENDTKILKQISMQAAEKLVQLQKS